MARSEERRVGKSVDLGGRRIIKKKNRSNERNQWKKLRRRIQKHTQYVDAQYS